MNLGKILGVASSNHIIIRTQNWNELKNIPKIGESVLTSENIKIGTIIDIFGPVVKPFISVQLKKSSGFNKDSFLDKRGVSLYTIPSSRKEKKIGKNFYKKRTPRRINPKKKKRSVTNGKKHDKF